MLDYLKFSLVLQIIAAGMFAGVVGVAGPGCATIPPPDETTFEIKPKYTNDNGNERFECETPLKFTWKKKSSE